MPATYVAEIVNLRFVAQNQIRDILNRLAADTGTLPDLVLLKKTLFVGPATHTISAVEIELKLP